MMDVDLQLAHDRARTGHDTRERVAALRHAAHVLGHNLPDGSVQRDTVRRIARRLRHDADMIDARNG